MKSLERIEAEKAYDKSLEVFRDASRKFSAITHKYRIREIGDEEFLAAREIFLQANRVADAAESEFINRINAEANKPIYP